MESNKIKILTVDDNLDNLISVKALIKETFPDALVYQALTGKRGLEIAAETNPDVILLDIVMPDMDGFDVCIKLKEDKNLNNIPVIFVTALKGDKESRIRALEVGAEAFLAKPIDQSELIAQIRAMLKIKIANIQKITESDRLTVLVAQRTKELNEANIASLNMLEDLKKEIRAREKSEAELKENEERFRNISLSISDISYSCKTDENNNYKLEWIFGATDIITGYPFEEIIDLECWGKLVVEDDFPTFKKHILDVKPGFTDSCQLRIKTRNGNINWIQASSKCVKQEGSETQFLFGGIVDITAQKQIEEKNRKLSTAVDQSSASIVITDLKGNIEYVNPKFCTLTGYTFEEAIGQNPRILKSGDATEEYYSTLWKTISSGNVWTGEFCNKKKNGDVFWEIASITPIVNDMGIISHYVAVKEDITARKGYEKQLKESEEKYRQLIENSHDIIYTMDAEGVFSFISGSWTSLLGHPINQIIGQNFSSFIHPDDVPEYTVWLLKIINTGKRLTSHQYRIQHIDGSWYWHISSAVPIRNKEGKLIGIEGTARDITEQKRAQDGLNDSEDKYSKAFQTSHYAITISRPKTGEFIEVNDAFTKISGYTREEAYSDSSINLNLWVNIDDRNWVVTNLSEGKNIEGKEFLFHRKSGEILNGLFSAQIIHLKGEAFILSSINDITENRKAEAEVKRMGKHYQALIEKSSEGIVLLDKNGKFKYISPSAKIIFGYDANEEIVAEPSENTHPDDLQMVLTELVKVIMEPSYIPIIEYRYATKTGNYIWIESVFSNLLADESVEALVLNFRNISERKLSDIALKESEEKYRLITEKINDVVWLMDLSGKSLFVSQSITNFTGYSVKEYLNQTIIDRFTPESAAIAMEAMKSEILLFAQTQAPPKDFTKMMVLDYRCKDGMVKTGEVIISPYFDENNKFIGLHGLTRDITQRKKDQDALKQSEEKYRTIFENVQDVFYQIDITGKILEISPSIKHFSEFNRDEIIGSNVLDLYNNPDDRGKFLSEIKEKRNILDYELDIKSKTGKVKHVSINASLVFNADGSPSHIDGAIRDISERKQAQDLLKESEEKYSKAFRTSPYAITISSIDTGVIIDTNNAFTSIMGFSRSETINNSDIGLNLWAYQRDRNWLVTTLMRGRTVAGKEFLFKKKNGEIVTGLVSAQIINLNGIPHILASINDITERKHAEGKLKLNEGFLKVVNAQLNDAQRIASIGSWTHVLSNELPDWSDEMFVIFGLDRKKGVPSYPEFRQLIHPEQHKMLDDVINLILSTGQGYSIELQIIRSDGSKRIVHQQCETIYNEKGIALYTLGTAQDITERKEAEAKLLESEEKLSTLFATMTEMVVMHELVFNDQGKVIDYRITDCNNAFTQVSGIKREDAIQKLATQVYQTEKAPYLEEYSQVAFTGNSYDYTTYYAPLEKHFMVSVVSPQKNHFATITTDITAIKQIQEVIIAKNRELESFLYITSHDLRSPLVNIQGFSKRLQKEINSIKNIIDECQIDPLLKTNIDDIAENRIPSDIHFILTNVVKMNNLINSLLQISRTGRVLMIIKKVDMNKLINTIISAHNFQLTEISAKAIVEDLPDCYGDENQLNQLFSNIISNAIKYSDTNKKLIIEISAHTHYNRVIYTIKDTGIGISPRHLEKIWNVFFRVNAAAPQAGDGIGLSIAKMIVDKHKGKISVESELDKGSTFKIELHKNKFTE